MFHFATMSNEGLDLMRLLSAVLPLQCLERRSFAKSLERTTESNRWWQKSSKSGWFFWLDSTYKSILIWLGGKWRCNALLWRQLGTGLRRRFRGTEITKTIILLRQLWHTWNVNFTISFWLTSLFSILGNQRRCKLLKNEFWLCMKTYHACWTIEYKSFSKSKLSKNWNLLPNFPKRALLSLIT